MSQDAPKRREFDPAFLDSYDPYKMVARLPERVLLMRDDDLDIHTAIYAVGWSGHDLLLEVEKTRNGITSLAATGVPFRSFITHAPYYVVEMDFEVIKSLWKNRPEASWIEVPEDYSWGQLSEQSEP